MPNHYNTMGGGKNNPIVEINLQALPGQFIFQQSRRPYVGPYHRHKNGELMIGVGQMGVNHPLKPNEIIVSANQTRAFGDELGYDDFDPDSFSDDLGFDNFDPDSNRRNLRQQQQGNPASFGDELGFDDFEPDRNRRNGLRQMGNQTRGFGDDLGYDGFDPEGFGDDLGFDGFDPEGGGMNRLGQQGNQTAGFGDDLGYDGYDPEGGGMSGINQQDNQAFGDGTNFFNYMVAARMAMEGAGQRKGGSMKNQGGLLQGPSHEQGGIPAIVGGTTPVELEGGEYIINAQTVDAVGQDFLDKLNSTQTMYHTGGYGAGQLPAPSYYKNGGKIMNNKVRRGRRTKPVPTRKMQHGGMHNSCPPGMIMRAGQCVSNARTAGTPRPGAGSYSSGYKKGGKVLNERKSRKPYVANRKRGGLVSRRNPKRFRTGGNVGMGMSYYGNSTTTTQLQSHSQVRRGSVPNNVVGSNVKRTLQDETGHMHQAIMDTNKNGHTSTVDGHSHEIKKGKITMTCPPGIGCHSHNL